MALGSPLESPIPEIRVSNQEENIMILSKNADEMTLLEIHYQPGVGAPLHVHSHESLAYVVKGKVKMTVGNEEYVLGPGDVCRHPQGVPHGVEGLEESIVVEIKSPAPDITTFLGI